MLQGLRGRQEWALAQALWRADRRLAAAWWTVLVLRGCCRPGWAMGVLVGAVQAGDVLTGPLVGMGVIFGPLQSSAADRSVQLLVRPGRPTSTTAARTRAAPAATTGPVPRPSTHPVTDPDHWPTASMGPVGTLRPWARRMSYQP